MTNDVPSFTSKGRLGFALSRLNELIEDDNDFGYAIDVVSYRYKLSDSEIELVKKEYDAQTAQEYNLRDATWLLANYKDRVMSITPGNLFEVTVSDYSDDRITELFTSIESATKYINEACEEGCYSASLRVWNGKVYDGRICFEKYEEGEVP